MQAIQQEVPASQTSQSAAHPSEPKVGIEIVKSPGLPHKFYRGSRPGRLFIERDSGKGKAA